MKFFEVDFLFLFFVHQFLFNRFAQIPLLILHPRPVRTPTTQPPPPLPVFIPYLVFLLFTSSYSSKKRMEREFCRLEGWMDGVSPVVGSKAIDVRAQQEEDLGW